jgi:NitT/TauT family transport system permease protein
MAHLESDRRAGSPESSRFSLSNKIQLNFSFKGKLISGLIFAGLLLSWELAVQFGVISPLYFPPPSFIFQKIGFLLGNGTLLDNTLITLARMLIGLVIGGSLGLILGLIMGWSESFREVVDPFVAAIHPLPKIAILPLIMVIFGIGNFSIMIVVAAGAFFPMLINTMSGVVQIHPIHFDVARNYKANSMKVFQRVILPGSAPSILAGLRLALNTTLLITVAVEMVSSLSGLGGMIWMAWTTMRIEEIYASLVVITLFGISINLLLMLLTAWLLPWQENRSS